jgi:hypothetical protein
VTELNYYYRIGISTISDIIQEAVAYPGFFRGRGVQQIQLTTEGRENGGLGAIAP